MIGRLAWLPCGAAQGMLLRCWGFMVWACWMEAHRGVDLPVCVCAAWDVQVGVDDSLSERPAFEAQTVSRKKEVCFTMDFRFVGV